ncbi:hypothetical protein KL933_004858 [Ogataea haglerorum]|uniref:Uncharacterized protein n=1 Tax=Ogataea haglerorum TaxID=1937702 RepID=A0AAN6HYH7_9ASCO|nr:hypothetical protein KL915_004842 [Ogataea haglerorum]KAG7703666.1 hypothetical protein KL914_004623 [Ogataea haglerorum]KAG7704087.1 hypothetical protein KL950_004414 [Ogataea haglerorum]KAG7714012.1 hypothetical protein KL913_004703 [Ogataea haglerorum]KAG7714506.1 hypothetical protein KL949_004742 [Ogataea haglerorum]
MPYLKEYVKSISSAHEVSGEACLVFVAQHPPPHLQDLDGAFLVPDALLWDCQKYATAASRTNVHLPPEIRYREATARPTISEESIEKVEFRFEGRKIAR